MTQEINETVVNKLISVIGAGLCKGMGNPKPGEMCVEAAVCYAMDLPHSDNPICVSQAIRAIKIGINDANWSSNEARAKGMMKLAILQLGTNKDFDEKEFIRRVVEVTISKVIPSALRHAASIHTKQEHKEALEAAAIRCEQEKTSDAARAASDAASYAASDAASDAARAASDAASYAASDAARAAAVDKELLIFTKEIENILIDMKVPSTKYLDLLDKE